MIWETSKQLRINIEIMKSNFTLGKRGQTGGAIADPVLQMLVFLVDVGQLAHDLGIGAIHTTSVASWLTYLYPSICRGYSRICCSLCSKDARTSSFPGFPRRTAWLSPEAVFWREGPKCRRIWRAGPTWPWFRKDWKLPASRSGSRLLQLPARTGVSFSSFIIRQTVLPFFVPI